MVPNHPMLVQAFGAMACVEMASGFVCRIHIHTNTQRFLLSEPSGQETQQLRRCPISSTLRNDVDPLQLSVAVITLREMARDKADKGTIFQRNINNARHQRLLRMQLAVHVTRDARYPAFLCSTFRSPDASHGNNVGFVRLSVLHSAHGGVSITHAKTPLPCPRTAGTTY